MFDLDGVVFDTESQYSLFWGMKGKTYHPEVEHFENDKGTDACADFRPMVCRMR